MKKLLLGAMLASSGLAFSQTSVTSDIVGYITIEVQPNSDALVGLPMERDLVQTGSLTANPNGNVLTSTGANFPDLTANDPHYIKFTSGSSEGLVAAIMSNNANTLTVSTQSGQDLTGVANGDTYEIIPFWTPSTLFPNGVANNTELFFFNSLDTGINISTDTVLRYNEVANQWRIGFSDQSDYAIYPGEGFIVRNNSASLMETVTAGKVQTTQSIITLLKYNSGAQDTVISLSNPVAETINTIDFGASNNDQILVFDNSATGTNKSAVRTYRFNAASNEWRQGFSAVNVSFEGGDAFIYRRNDAATASRNIAETLNN